MWLFTRYGFFSAVCAREGDGRHGNAPDPGKIMVRARRRDDLTRLMARCRDLLESDVDIHESGSTDYRYRIFLPKTTWSKMVSLLAEDIDYDNFKSAAHRELDSKPGGREYTESLMDVWSVMDQLQHD